MVHDRVATALRGLACFRTLLHDWPGIVEYTDTLHTIDSWTLPCLAWFVLAVPGFVDPCHVFGLAFLCS